MADAGVLLQIGLQLRTIHVCDCFGRGEPELLTSASRL